MGQPQSVISIKEAESTACPGTGCFTTGPLDELCDYDRLWEEVYAGMRTDFTKDPTVKHGEVTEISKHEFQIMRVHDGEKLKLPFPELRLKLCYRLDKDKGLIIEEDREPDLDFLRDLRIIRTLRDPLRLEVASQRIVGDGLCRRAGPLIQLAIYTLLKGILKREVETFPMLPSKLMPFPDVFSAYSESLEKDIGSAEELYNSMLETLKTMAHDPDAKDVDVTESRKDEIKERFTVSLTHKDRKLYTRMEAVETARTISIATYDEVTNQLLDMMYLAVHKDPVQIEAWGCVVFRHEVDPDASRRPINLVELNKYCYTLLQRLDKL